MTLTLPPPRVYGPVTRTDVVRYQGASGDLNPVHHDEPFARAAGFPAPLGVGMSEERGMHAEQEYVFHGPPPPAGTKLVCTSRIESITEKQGKRGGTLTFAVMVTELRDAASGRLVAEARMTGVETEHAPEGQ